MRELPSCRKREFEKLQVEIQKRVYTKVSELEICAWRSPEPLPFARRFEGERISLKPGSSWGGLFDCAWFNFKGFPPKGHEKEKLVLLLYVNGELCVCDSKGEPLRGLTCVSSDGDVAIGRFEKRVFPLQRSGKGYGPVDIWADAGCNDLFGNLHDNAAIRDAHIAVCNEELRLLYYDYEVLLNLAKELPQDSARAAQAYEAIDRASLLLREFSASEAKAARRVLAPELAKRNGDLSMSVSAIGHAHIDLAWLWPIRETIRKGARTFSTALANMELYPDYVFGASQPQLFQWIKDNYPGLYKRVKAKVAEGRFEVQGGMWVEADTNMIGGEAMIRQFLYGKRFFKEEFGVDVKSLWLPDVFGYSGALPQVMAKCGIEIFMTQKLSWSLVNKFPHHSFVWRGVDGSSVLAHMLPENSYNSSALPGGVLRNERNNSDKGFCARSLMLFGIGDGGGGPGEEHLERLSRLKNLAGVPAVVQEPAAKFFEKWRADSAKFPEWLGELYLERHQGTLTTQAASKRLNRKIEFALRELEWTAASAFALKGAEYPAARLESLWKEALLYQFHDILPGSSIKRVYDESKARYAAMLSEIEALTEKARASLAGSSSGPVLFNSLPWARSEWLKLGSSWLKAEVPAMGYASVPAKPVKMKTVAKASSKSLENDLLKASFNADGSIASLWDKELEREILAAPANVLNVYYDDGDAWDFSLSYAGRAPRRMKLETSKARVDGPCAILEQRYSLGHSRLLQTIILRSGSKLLEFSCKAVWRECDSMLRASFPVDIFADSANFEIQFGHVARPTHDNTSWDSAKLEVPMHKWADLSQRDYGVALLNDCKYGCKVKGNAIDINLIRSMPHPGSVVFDDSKLKPGEPNHKYGDQCEHEFRYALLPHKGDHVEGGVVRAGYEFNVPLAIFESKSSKKASAAEFLSLVELDSKDIMLEAVKLSEDGKALVLRLYETSKARVPASLRFKFKAKSFEETDMLEGNGRKLALSSDGSLKLVFKPFEIKTLKAVLA